MWNLFKVFCGQTFFGVKFIVVLKFIRWCDPKIGNEQKVEEI